MQFKDRLKLKREEAGLTQEQLSEKAHIPLQDIIDYEIGKKLPRLASLSMLQIALVCNVESLMTEEEFFLSDIQEQAKYDFNTDVVGLASEVVVNPSIKNLDEDDARNIKRLIILAYIKACKEDGKEITAEDLKRLNGKLFID